MKIRLLTTRVTADPKEQLQPRGSILDTAAGEISEGDAERLVSSGQAEVIGGAKPKAKPKAKAPAAPAEKPKRTRKPKQKTLDEPTED